MFRGQKHNESIAFIHDRKRNGKLKKFDGYIFKDLDGYIIIQKSHTLLVIDLI